MKLRTALSRTALLLMIVGALPAFGAREKKKEPVGTMTATASVVEWQPVIDHERLLLTVVNPEGEVFVREFPAGRNPSYRLQDGPPGSAVDGVYTYEIRVVPRISGDVRKRLQDARKAGDDAAVARIRREAGLHNEVVQSGGFTVLNGMFVSSELDEATSHDSLQSGLPTNSATSGEPAEKSDEGKPPLRQTPHDQVIPDDLIVQGSGCFGFDCVNNESFSFDTIRLKENNLRIGFDDTSASGFPANDWQITANDSASGGASKFSVEDITGARVPFTIEAATPTNTLYLDSTGRVGFRTATPVLDIHTVTGDTPAIRLEQNATGGFSPQTWDVAGNEANFFVRDVTGGSRLPLRIRPGAPTSSIDISANGDVGVGTTSPQAKLHLFSLAGSDVRLGLGEYPGAASGTGPGFNIGYSGSSLGRGAAFLSSRADPGSVSPNPSIRFFTADVQRIIFDNQGNIGLGVADPTAPIHHSSGAYLSYGGVWTNASSRENKRDIAPLDSEEALCALSELSPVRYAYKQDPSEHHVGFIAEDVPDIVATPDRKGLSPMDIVAVLTKVVQEQQKTIEELKTRVTQLEYQK